MLTLKAIFQDWRANTNNDIISWKCFFPSQRSVTFHSSKSAFYLSLYCGSEHADQQSLLTSGTLSIPNLSGHILRRGATYLCTIWLVAKIRWEQRTKILFMIILAVWELGVGLHLCMCVWAQEKDMGGGEASMFLCLLYTVAVQKS